MRRTILPYLLAIPFLISSCSEREDPFIDENFQFAALQTEIMLTALKDSSRMPKSVSDTARLLSSVGITDWTSGFFPGSLWYLYEHTGAEHWKDAAEMYTHRLAPIQHYREHHDIGFMMYCSYGNAYRITKNKAYEDILLNAARSLASRYIPAAGVIRSWDYKKSWDGTDWHCPVIIDNMMNLELLFFASRLSNDPTYSDIAVSHAERTIENHIRDDYSCFHVVDYDTISGQVTDKATFQGYADNSAWARGQAWAVYGFTMVYRETQDRKFLDVAKKMADFYLNHPNLPDDGVPYWDFNIGEDGFNPPWPYTAEKISRAKLRDVSAAAVMSSALFELSTYLGDEGRPYYLEAEHMVRSMADGYRNTDNATGFILDHSVGNFPRYYEIDVPLVYADYYFLEALSRYRKSLSSLK